MTVGVRAGWASRGCYRCAAPPLGLGRAVQHVQGRAKSATCRRRATWRRPVRNTVLSVWCYDGGASCCGVVRASCDGALLGQTSAAVLVSTILLRRKYHGCEGRKGLLPQHARRAVRVHGLKCSPCVLRAADEAFRHRTCTVTIVALCCAVLRCWIKISIYIFFSDIYLQLIIEKFDVTCI